MKNRLKVNRRARRGICPDCGSEKLHTLVVGGGSYEVKGALASFVRQFIRTAQYCEACGIGNKEALTKCA